MSGHPARAMGAEPPTAFSSPTHRLTLTNDRELVFGDRPLVMGVVNITPDSFSDGGRWLSPEQAVAHGRQLLEEGADLLDLGAESTRPGGGVYGSGAEEVSQEEELDRLLPVVEALRKETSVCLSIDTRKAAVASAALAHGGDLINDISALGDPTMASLASARGCPVVLMHSRGNLNEMQRAIDFSDVAAEVASELLEQAKVAVCAGVAHDQIVLDPGIGFGKTAEQNLALLRALPSLAELGFPLLVGASRKSFIASVHDAAPDRRLGGSLAAAAWAMQCGPTILRVHDVFETRQFVDVWNAVRAHNLRNQGASE